MKRPAFVFSIEAILALAAALALASYPLAGPSQLYGEIHLAQLSQDLAEITVKSPENARALAEFAATGDGAFLEEKYSALLGQLGEYCVRLESGGNTLEANCRGSAGDRFSSERIFWGGSSFKTARLSVSLNRGE